jgi:DNA repair protein RecN (Recombination protein N)
VLTALRINDFAIIGGLEVDFGPGLNVLTGETGAGKSIIVEALSVVLGGRASTEMVRTGSEQAVVEAAFDPEAAPGLRKTLESLDLPSDEEALVLRRTVSASGRSRASVNGAMATAAALQKVGERLVDIHGQHEHQLLLKSDAHLELLDAYGRLVGARQELSDLVEQAEALRSELERLTLGERERAQRQDLLRYQVKEIEAARLVEGEEEAQTQERERLVHAEKLASAAYQGAESLYSADGAVTEEIQAVLSQLEEAAGIDTTLRPPAEELRAALVAIQETARALEAYAAGVESDTQRLESVEDRLELIRGLKRKYGSTVEEVMAHGKECARELEGLEGSEERIPELAKELKELQDKVAERALELSARRRQVASELEEAVVAQLRSLHMEAVRFQASFGLVPDPEGFCLFEGKPVVVGPSGIDRVEFLFSPNPGEALKPLAKIASGGELSRFMLAVKQILARADGIPVLIFDEVDVGIGGRVAATVGEKLKALAAGCQVFCITHLPQIAHQADRHYRVTKAVDEGRAQTRLEVLSGEERVEELARMAAGEEVTEAARRHAEEMVQSARADSRRSKKR